MREKSFISRALSYIFRSGAEEVSTPGDAGQAAAKAEDSVSNDQDQSKKHVISPKEVMDGLCVQVYEAGAEDSYLVGFQGGVFVFNFTKNCLVVFYNDILECAYEDTVKATMIANDVNGDYSAWSCYLRTSMNGRADMPVKVCMSQLFSLDGDLDSILSFIRSVMINAFTVARDFRTRFEEAHNNNQSLVDILNKRDFINKLELAKRMMEVDNWDQIGNENPDDESLKLDALADLFADTEFGSLLTLQVVTDQVSEVINDAESIHNFDIRTYLRNHPKCEEINAVTVVAGFEKQNLIVHLKKMLGSTAKSLFFQMNVMRSGVDTDRFHASHTAVSCRATVEIRLTTDQEDYWEVKYMVEEAKDKYKSHHEAELSDEQKLLLIELCPTIQDDLYWGMKFYSRNCWFQSLFYLHRLYYNLLRLEPDYPNEAKIIPDVALYIGVIYSQMKLYDRAYYYLDKAREKGSVYALETYITCMCNLRDVSVIEFIKDCLKTVNKQLEEDDNTDQYYEFYLFLKRHLVQMYIHEHRLISAAELLHQMVENGEDVDFALRKLHLINKKIKRESSQEEERQQSADGDSSMDISDTASDHPDV